MRRWNHLPIDRNFLIFSYAHTTGQIGVDAVYEIEDANVEMDTWTFAYLRTFELLGKTARFDVRQSYKTGTWSGLLSGVPRSVTRDGFDDLNLRFSIDLFGAPPLKGPAYVSFRAGLKEETIVGMALGVQLPTGQYLDDKVINLGSNRVVFRPQLGFQHLHGDWVYELSASASIFTANPDFNGGQELLQSPIYSLDGSLEYLFGGGFWVSAGLGLSMGGETTLDGLDRNDERRALAWILSAGMPVMTGLSLRVTYLGTENLAETGLSSQTFGLSLQSNW